MRDLLSWALATGMGGGLLVMKLFIAIVVVVCTLRWLGVGI